MGCFCYSDNPVVLFNGEKDSTTVLHLVRSIRPETPAMFNNTGVEARETIEMTDKCPLCLNENCRWHNLVMGNKACEEGD